MDNNAAKKIAVTEGLIKDAFLTALKREKYAEITISDICRLANIGRSTFYRRYESIPFVVNDIFADMLSSISNIHEHVMGTDILCKTPLCQFVRENEKYSAILVDGALSEAFISYAVENRIDSVADDRADLNEAQKRTLKEFLLSGCVYVIRRNLRADADKWDSFKCVIDEFIRNGCRQVKA